MVLPTGIGSNHRKLSLPHRKCHNSLPTPPQTNRHSLPDSHFQRVVSAVAVLAAAVLAAAVDGSAVAAGVQGGSAVVGSHGHGTAEQLPAAVAGHWGRSSASAAAGRQSTVDAVAVGATAER